jgi:hypothetical protein
VSGKLKFATRFGFLRCAPRSTRALELLPHGRYDREEVKELEGGRRKEEVVVKKEVKRGKEPPGD